MNNSVKKFLVATMAFYQIAQVGLMGFSIAKAVEPKSFSDVPMSHANYQAIMYLQQKGIISGYPDGTFKPNQAVNRVEALKMIYGIEDFNYWNLADGPIFVDGGNVNVPFKDIDKSQWYFKYLQMAYNEGVVGGYPDGSFKPTQTVNQVENLKMLLERTYLKIDHKDDIVVDTDSPQWYSPYVVYANQRNLIASPANFNAAQPMTRAALAEVIYRTLKTNSEGNYNEGLNRFVPYTVEYDQDIKKNVLMNNGKVFATLPQEFTVQDDVGVLFRKVTDKYLYVSQCSGGMGGYIFYEQCSKFNQIGGTYQIELATGKVTQIDYSSDIIILADVSSDDKVRVWLKHSDSDRSIIYEGVDEGAKQFPIEVKYLQFGSAHLSPDGQKLAYAAMVGNPDNEESAVFEIDLKTGNQTKIAEDKGVSYFVYGWTDKGDLKYTPISL